MPSLTRREFLKAAALTLAAGRLAAACGSGEDDAVVSRSEPLRFPGYAGLADLPWFERDAEGRLRCTADLPPIVDFHVHLGFAYAAAPRLDLQAASPRVQYLFDFDGPPAATLDLHGYANQCATPDMLDRMDAEVTACLFQGSQAARTHTIPNLLAEMDRIGVARAVVLPIALGLDQGDDSTREWLAAIRDAGASQRLVSFGSVHPNDPQKRQKLQEYRTLGIRGVKVHPTMQMVWPDAPEVFEIYEECQRLGLPVLIHCGRAGVEMPAMQEFAVAAGYEAAAREFPGVRFVLAHAGARLDWRPILDLAKACPNVWLEMSGQGVDELATIVDELGPERLLFGTDWPFYAEAPMIAKVLIVAGRDHGVRDRLLRDNAEAFLAS